MLVPDLGKNFDGFEKVVGIYEIDLTYLGKGLSGSEIDLVLNL